MKEDQKESLRSSYQTIVNSVQVYNVVPRLVQDAILTEHDAAKIHAAETNQEGMIRLMAIVMNSNKACAFDCFLSALEKDQEDKHIADAIRRSLSNLRRQTLQHQHARVDIPVERIAIENGLHQTTTTGPQETSSRHKEVDRTVSLPDLKKSYWIPDDDSNLYYIIIKKDENGSLCGFDFKKNERIHGFTITTIDSHSNAATTQLMEGDILRTVNAHNVCNMSSDLVKDIISGREKRLILGIIRLNHRIVKYDIDISIQNTVNNTDFGMRWICGDGWPRYNGDKVCYVHDVKPGSLADILGIQKGDNLVSVDGHTLQGIPFGIVNRTLMPALNDPDGTVLTVTRTMFEEY